MGKLQGKVAFVAGGSQGIGEQTALLFGREGASVAVVASSDLPMRADFLVELRSSPWTTISNPRQMATTECTEIDVPHLAATKKGAWQ
jgi:NAD(P)-dependent dehydrogenase (short-subunit alcohol dehydrogenase family)